MVTALVLDECQLGNLAAHFA